MARPEEPREPKQSWRAQAAHAWMWAIPQADPDTLDEEVTAA